MKQLTTLLVVLLSGCATVQFSAMENDHYRLQKNSDVCVIGSPDGVKSDLMMEATKFCAGRRERSVEVSSEGEYGIPYIRCASASLVFRCEAQSSPATK